MISFLCIEKIGQFLPKSVAEAVEQIIVVGFRGRDQAFASFCLLIKQFTISVGDDAVAFAMKNQDGNVAFGKKPVVQELISWK